MQLVQASGQVQRSSREGSEGSGEGSGEGLGGFGAEPFNRVPEKVPQKVPGSLGAKPNQIQQDSGEGSEGSREGLGGFGAEPGQVQQGCGGSGAEPGSSQNHTGTKTVRMYMAKFHTLKLEGSRMPPPGDKHGGFQNQKIIVAPPVP